MKMHMWREIKLKSNFIDLFSDEIWTKTVIIQLVTWCKECRAEASMKTENREERKRRFNGSLELRTVRGRDREREREKNTENKTLFQKL